MRARALLAAAVLCGSAAGAGPDPRLLPLLTLPEETLSDTCRNGAVLLRWERWLTPPAGLDVGATVEDIIAEVNIPRVGELGGMGCREVWIRGFLQCTGDLRFHLFAPPDTEAALLALMQDCLSRLQAVGAEPAADSPSAPQP